MHKYVSSRADPNPWCAHWKCDTHSPFFQLLDCGIKMQLLDPSLVRDIASCSVRLAPQPPGHQHTDQSVPTLPTVLLEFHTMGMMSWQRLPEQGKKEAPLSQT